jgi:NAD(P)-dependent dehydrogenase (short-subunit alcohol dehydrogenase family)
MSRSKTIPSFFDRLWLAGHTFKMSTSLILDPPLSTPSLGVAGRSFLVTGGTQGLGLAIARLLKQQGAAGLALVSRNADKGALVCHELSDESCRCVHIQADLSKAEEASSVMPRGVELLKDVAPISGVVNAAATCARGNLFTETAQGFDRQIAINTRAPFLITQAAALHMIEANVGGSIVNIGSCAAHGGAPFVMAYSTSKAAVTAMTKTHAAELAPKKIRVNAVNMGWTFTDNENALQNQRQSNWLEQADAGVPLGRIMRPQDVACTVVFLLSGASNMMTGSVIELHPEWADGLISLVDDEDKGR